MLIFLPACRSSLEDAGDRPLVPLEACHLDGGVEARCGMLVVPENYSLEDGRTIDLNIAVIPAVNSVAEPDPFIMLAGGPGQAATEAFAPFLSLLDDLNETRDIVLVDQRGTGESSPLSCPGLEEETDDLSLSDEEAADVLQRCATEMSETADLAQYTTDIAAADLDAVREALGYQQVNLYGLSYGTRAAQAYARLYPERVRALVLDSVTSPELILFLQMPRDGQRALELMFARCAADEACSENFPDLAAEYEALLLRLDEQDEELTITHPLSGEDAEFTLTRDRFTNFVYAILYSTDLVSLLPLLVHDAYETDDFETLVSQGILVSAGAGLNLGLLYAVACSEDAPLIDASEVAAIQADTSFAPRAEFFLEICEAFPTAEISADFRRPLVSEGPVLLLSGDADPVTPPAYAAQVARNLPNSRHIILPHYGHGLIGVGCFPEIITQFIADRAVDDIDSSCLDGFQPPPFFVDYAGPEP